MTKGLLELSPRKQIEQVKEGLGFHFIEILGQKLELSIDLLSPLIGIAPATLHRRKKEGRLRSEESGRVVRYLGLLMEAGNVLGSESAGLRWLQSPQRGLGGAVPLEYAMTELGAREVEKLLGRIDYGVYS